MTRARTRAAAAFLLLIAALTSLTSGTAAAAGVLVPSVDCVDYDPATSTYTAYFSALNTGTTTVFVPLGSNNLVLEPPNIRTGQPTTFSPGTTSWSTTFASGSTATWSLQGLTAAASAASAVCTSGPESVVEPPSIFGTLAVGRTVVVAGEQPKLNFTDYDVTFEWRHCDVDGGAVVDTGRTHTVTSADLGHRLQASVIYLNVGSGNALTLSTPCDASGDVGSSPSADVVPHVAGDAVVGGTLSLVGGSWSGTGTVSEDVAWESCDLVSCTAAGSGAAYSPAADDLGRWIRATLTASSPFGGAQVTTAAVGPVSDAEPVGSGGTLDPAALDFGAVPVGAVAEQAVVYTNTTSDAVRLLRVTRSGGQATDFTLGGSCVRDAVVDPGASCSVLVRFAPRWTGDRRATLVVDAGTVLTVPLSGTGAAANVLTVSESAMDLGTVPVGRSGTPRTVTLTNDGSSGVLVTGVVRSGGEATDFPVTTDCSTTVPLAAGESCTVTVTFRPRAEGARSATLLVRSTAAAGTQYVDLTGTGERGPAVGLSRTDVDLGSVPVGQRSAPQSVTVTNVGSSPLTITSVVRTGPNRTEFSLASDCTAPLAVGESCTLTTTLRPGGTGTRTASLSIRSDDPAGTRVVQLTGAGT